MSPDILQGVLRFHKPFIQQSLAVANAISDNVGGYPIACVALYGSVLTGVGPNSDVDILVLLRDDYKEQGFNFLDLCLDLEDSVNAARVNDIPVDLHVSIARDFLDTSRDTDFKRSISNNNVIIWEDGETLGPFVVEFA